MTISKGYGIGVGKVWERGALDVNGDSYINGDLNIGSRQFTGRLNSEYIPPKVAPLTPKEYIISPCFTNQQRIKNP
jgi:hypothetical protein